MLSTTASSLLSLLDEEDPKLQIYALSQLNQIVDDFWAEISESIEKIEVLYEDEKFEKKELAAIVASKVYYHLGDLSDAMSCALNSGDLFEIRKRTEYTETLVTKCVEEYISKKIDLYEKKTEEPVDPKLESIIERLFEGCLQEKEYKEALGIALESRREDKIVEIFSIAENTEEIMEYCFQVSNKLITSRDFRHTVFKILVEKYQTLSSPDYITVVRILVFLDDSVLTSSILLNLLNGKESDVLLSYQIAFDLVTNATQQFRDKLRKLLKEKLDDESAVGPASIASESPFQTSLNRTLQILTGETTILSNLEFLHKNNRADMGILKNTKLASEVRNSVTHSAIIFANAAMNAGTTRDSFLRENLEWLSRATNWAKFSATAGLGVIHKGHLKQGRKILGDYLPQKPSTSPYSEGGALYALGLIFANHGEEVTEYMISCLAEYPESVQIQHGVSLGLGIAGVATGNNVIYNELKKVLIMDNASAGEAAGIAMGLVKLGTADEMAMTDMITAAHDTTHEKIIRGLAVGVSFLVYGREEQADNLINELTSDKDPVLRYGGVYCIGLAYCGTSNNNAIRKLLHFAVSDVSDDVRRAAVMCLGFVLSREPEQCPRIVSLLAESYNPHVRYGATMAVGIACAGTGLSEAIDLLLPMASDKIDFVRQGAFIALAMVLVQRTTAQEPRVATVRKLYEEKIADPHELTMAKFGAIMAQGIIDAGGRNCTINLHSISGHKNLLSIVGLTVFTQYWYWYPFTHFISLSFTPTAIIGLNKDLKVPKLEFISNARPSLFAYPPDIKPPAAVAVTKVAAPVLSTARKAKSKSQKDAMAVEEEKKDEKEEKKDEEKKESEEKKKRRKKEPTFEIKQNPARITVEQLKYISFKDDERFQPVRANKKGDLFGIVVLQDSKPELPEDIVDSAENANNNANNAIQEDEPSAPADFEFQD